MNSATFLTSFLEGCLHRLLSMSQCSGVLMTMFASLSMA